MMEDLTLGSQDKRRKEHEQDVVGGGSLANRVKSEPAVCSLRSEAARSMPQTRRVTESEIMTYAKRMKTQTVYVGEEKFW